MAQPLFDEHPLEEYLREAGETPLLIPGSSSEWEREIDPYFDFVDEEGEAQEGSLADWYPQYVIELVELLQSVLSSLDPPKPPNAFVERFKYNVISSSLLATALPTPLPGRMSRTGLSIPGGHSRVSSIDLGHPASPPEPTNPDGSYGPLSLAVGCGALFFSIGYPSLTLLSIIATLLFLYHSFHMTETPKHDMTSSFNALDDLIVANDSWESVVQDAVAHLDNEERNQFQNPLSPSSPSPVRLALHSCFQTTHTQCDNIRHLFSALTSPTDLSQISEMYAPPSPTKLTFTLDPHSSPFSFASQRLQKSPTPPSRRDKRSTWNGSYASLSYATSPTSPLGRRRDKHRANISDIFQTGTTSAPTTPLIHTSSVSSKLAEVPEDPVAGEQQVEIQPPTSPEAFHFGTAALELQRQRKSGGMDAFREPTTDIFTSVDPRTPRSGRESLFSSTFSSSSKFTNPKSARHPLSYSSLNQTLQGTLAAKRYACSHLLALRFMEDEDEGYWEDVRSVVSLLTSALTDSFSRLASALEEAERQNLQDQNPTPLTTNFELPDTSPESGRLVGVDAPQKKRKSTNRISFAPMPTHVSRFAAHVAAISSALDDARDNLEQCVSALKSGATSSTSSPSSSKRRSLSKENVDGDAEEEVYEALQAYERLRRELGLALRECERGRERLVELVNPPELSDDEEDFDDVPSLRHDCSDDSDKPDQMSPSSDDEGEMMAAAASSGGGSAAVEAEGSAAMDDVTSHLLLTTSTQHLPMPGIEEVYEADTGPKVVFTRERSKLSREERIRIAKARRESGMGLGIGAGALGGSNEGEEEVGVGKRAVEKWGPGGEVVQELKDMIWKVGERKRQMMSVGNRDGDGASPALPLPQLAPPSVAAVAAAPVSENGPVSLLESL
ncbi:hypothetical protein D9613_007209 [Agrocybe pediades]|uniref:Uncharacterized protein n=1 Tax=Agrocybe pediades TaxID=84607 RepID=A0A8H4QGR0_9AGAR|nr:hypothetical protein D9613_007209 [Agrocybe pediades]